MCLLMLGQMLEQLAACQSLPCFTVCSLIANKFDLISLGVPKQPCADTGLPRLCIKRQASRDYVAIVYPDVLLGVLRRLIRCVVCKNFIRFMTFCLALLCNNDSSVRHTLALCYRGLRNGFRHQVAHDFTLIIHK